MTSSFAFARNKKMVIWWPRDFIMTKSHHVFKDSMTDEPYYINAKLQRKHEYRNTFRRQIEV